MAPQFPDHFSAAAPAYARFRPTYPEALFTWLATISPGHSRAWGCATGSGQAAGPLAQRFKTVIASDASLGQLRMMGRRPVHRLAALAEVAPIRAATVDLVTIAQALHWFDLPRFYADVRRCLVPGGILAVWTYARCLIRPEIDTLLQEFHDGTLAGCWPPERALVESG